MQLSRAGVVAIALAITLVLEVPIVAAFYPGHRLRMAMAAVMANVTTNLTLNVALVYAGLSYHPALLTGEAGALGFEMIVYAMVAPRIGKRHDWWRALAASGAANFASFGAGLLLFGS
jgi:hypothetical protein